LGGDNAGKKMMAILSAKLLKPWNKNKALDIGFSHEKNQ